MDDVGGEMDNEGSENEPVGDEVLLALPEELRSVFKEPLGDLHTNVEELLSATGDPLVSVGDVVTHHLDVAKTGPDLAVIDWETERESLPNDRRPELTGYEERIDVSNPPGALTVELLEALRTGFDSDARTVVVVDGEEDLTTLPALVAAPDGASVVYGQPGDGMVHVRVTESTRERARDLLGRMAGEKRRALSVLGVE